MAQKQAFPVKTGVFPLLILLWVLMLTVSLMGGPQSLLSLGAAVGDGLSIVCENPQPLDQCAPACHLDICEGESNEPGDPGIKKHGFRDGEFSILAEKRPALDPSLFPDSIFHPPIHS
jgi:hypothetical protein